MKGVLWTLVPDQALILIVVGIGALSMIGLMRGKVLSALLGLVIIPVLVAPFFESLFAALPLWVSLCTLAIYGVLLVRAVMELLIGRKATDEAVAKLVATGVLGVFSTFFVRPLKRLLGARRGARIRRL